jgi:hypothetical protein
MGKKKRPEASSTGRTIEVEPLQRPELNIRISQDVSFVGFVLSNMFHMYLHQMEKHFPPVNLDLVRTSIAVYGNWFRSNFRYSFVVSLYSALETILRAVCNHDARQQNLQIRFNDLAPKGNAIERTKVYIKKVRQSGHKLDNTLWQPVQDLVKIRNCIVHGSGDVSYKSAKVSQTLRSIAKNKQRPGYLIRDDQIILHKEFCEWALESVRQFCEHMREVLGLPQWIHLKPPKPKPNITESL